MAERCVVELTGPELWLAGMTGLARWIESRLHQRVPLNDQDRYTALADDLFGAFAEAAFAKFTQAYWLGEWLNHKKVDVGAFQVRHTRRANGRLLLQAGDADDERFALVVGMPPRLCIAGWILGRDGKASRFWDETLPRPCYAVPQTELREVTLA